MRRFFRRGRSRKPKPFMIIRRRTSYGGHFGVAHRWVLYCTRCDHGGIYYTWDRAITAAKGHSICPPR